MNQIGYIAALTLLLLTGSSLRAQEDTTLVQLSGVVLTEDDRGQLMPLSLADVYVKGKNRGTYTDFDGFFSMVVRKGETIVFSYLGYRSVEYYVPDTLSDSRYTVVQYLSKDTLLLPETVIYPWPSKKFFRLEFLAMQLPNVDYQAMANANLNERIMRQLSENMPGNADESADLYLRQQANRYVYYGQFQPQNIFNPLAWQQFFEAWKRGDYKRKEK
jgi:hypothetical protein